MTDDFINAAIAGVYEHSARMVRSCADSGAREWVIYKTGRIVEGIKALQAAEAPRNAKSQEVTGGD